MRARARWVWIVLPVLAVGLAAAENGDLVERALSAMERGSLDDWAFTQTMIENGTTTVIRHDPSLPEEDRWSVVSIDGRPPTDEERDELAVRRARDEERSEADDDGEHEIRAMIEPSSLTLIEETGSHATYSFQPTAEDEDDRKIYDHVDATLRIVKAPPHVAAIEMRSPEPFSAGFGFKIKEFELLLSYAPTGDEATVLPRKVITRIVGRAMLVKKVEQTVEVVYRDFRRVGPSP